MCEMKLIPASEEQHEQQRQQEQKTRECVRRVASYLGYD